MSAELNAEKLFYERFWTLHSDLQLVEVFKRFGVEAFRRSSVLEGFQTALRSFKFSGKCCVEIGTRHGLTAVVLSRYFDKVVSFDIHPSPLKHQIVEFLDIKNIQFLDVADNFAKALAISAVEFDAAYVDGDHTHDTHSDFELTRRCGRVLFHEYWQAQPSVWGKVNELRARGKVSILGKLALWEA